MKFRHLILLTFLVMPLLIQAHVKKACENSQNSNLIPYLTKTLLQDNIIKQQSAAGTPAPPFSLKNDKGKTVSLKNFKGKIVYIYFWETACRLCLEDIKTYIPDLHKRYKGKDVVFINICMDTNAKKWKDTLTKYNLKGINLIAGNPANEKLRKDYNIVTIPHYVLLDKKGNIVEIPTRKPLELFIMASKTPIDKLLSD
ncbi:Redoxin domain protein [Pseudopedobacter saltans DSM 12145]|uniref:Redoxin domain protein n=1 Tax=Pseudopedobacter saltans (strain ATCC 51119 / DSM 12145 / JCM 21818 / CCUG 39354 / LMG 10337 / NBRC 100064 / NCIMB 13643) TaxID=762903 RepID=F0SCU1_PSESL|nr:TlpA disulfide reductase family protein [Pseudopedobacter saltans]ADY50680.1 Redoxin domain protein [Pseudopedobacter saltans DSM 12145]